MQDVRDRRAGAYAVILLALLVAALPCKTYAIEEREPLAMVVLLPTGTVAYARPAELARVAASVAHAETDFEIKAIDISTLKDCAGAIGCIALEARALSRSRWLLLVSAAKRGAGVDRVIALFVDMARVEDADRADREHFEDVVFESAVSNRATSPDIGGAPVLAAFVKSFLATGDHRGAPANVEVKSALADAELELDGKAAGVTCRGTTMLSGVKSGTRRLLARDRRGRTIELALAVPRSGTVEVSTFAVGEERAWLRDATLWSGVALAAGGTAITVYALSASGDRVLCPAPGATPECGRAEFASFGGSGVPIAPLGYGLIAAGATWALGTLVFERDEPWFSIAIGALLGAGAFTVSTLLSGSTSASAR